MFPLIESIRLVDGKLYNLAYNQVRMNYSYEHYYQEKCTYDLAKILSSIHLPESGVYKIRFLYNKSNYEIEIIPYQAKSIQTLQLVFDDSINYGLKYTARAPIDALFSLRKDADDILIVKQKQITDTSFCNIVLRHPNGEWHTPTSCLLKGTQRAHLIRTNLIKEANITTFNIQDYTHFMLINSMMPPDFSNVHPIKNIIL